MPRGDRRGPNGMGPMTGRAAGFCSGASAPGFANMGTAGGYGARMGDHRGFRGGFHGAACGPGMGRGYGQGYGTGFQPSYSAPVYSKETEKDYIENEVSFLKDRLKTLEGRLADMQEDE
jgi:hypothetical protein